MPPAALIRRSTCVRCLRAQSACICQWIRPTAHEVEVLILQHPLEVNHAKGSARLLHLSLPGSQLVTGEAFATTTLQALLRAPWQPEASASSPAHAVLLYPDAAQAAAPGMPEPPMPSNTLLQSPWRLRLVVLDGTWRKSRKMLHCNPPLRQLPRLALREVTDSRYLIRRAHRAGQLSTLEAVCAALAQLEGSAARFDPLLSAFDGFVQQQLRASARPGTRNPTPMPPLRALGPDHHDADNVIE